MFVCWSVKGGSGTTVVAAALALVLSRARSSLLVDLCGDVPAALGLPEPAGPGVRDWLASPTSGADALGGLTVRATADLQVLPRGAAATPAPTLRWAALGSALRDHPHTVVIDAGVGEPPAPLLAVPVTSLLVVRPCYLSVRRAVAADVKPTGIVLITEPGRALCVGDVERAIGAPVVAEVPYDPAVARMVDSGMLASRLPRSIDHSLRGAA
jgi:hypothetical protein